MLVQLNTKWFRQWYVATWNVLKCETHISVFYLADFFLLLFQSTKQVLKASERADPESHKFPSLFVTLTLNFDDILPWSMSTFKLRPHDLYCPSLQSSLQDQKSFFTILCFISNVKKTWQHKVQAVDCVLTNIGPEITRAKCIRPVWIAARRQRELMAVIDRKENTEDIEWLDEGEVDLSSVVLPGNSGDAFNNYDGRTLNFTLDRWYLVNFLN